MFSQIVRIVAAHRGGDRGGGAGGNVRGEPTVTVSNVRDKVSALNSPLFSAPSRRRASEPHRGGAGRGREPEAPPGRRRNGAHFFGGAYRGSIRGARTSRSFENSGARRSDARADSPVLESIISQHRVIPSPASVSFSASASSTFDFPLPGRVPKMPMHGVLWFSGFNPGTSLIIIASVLTLPFQLPCPL